MSWAKTHKENREGYERPDISNLSAIPAAVYVGLGETELAFECLERAARERNWLIAWLHLDPLWDSLRGDPRFQKLQQEQGLPR
jgi:hypothetical protein